MRVGPYAEQKNVMVQSHSCPHLHARIASALGKAAYGADRHMHPVHDEIFNGGAYYKDGRPHLTEEPGFGMHVDWKRVEVVTV